MNDSAHNDANSADLSAAERHRSTNAGQPETAGGLLRAAREKSGLHIAALAAALKVPVRKLEALEANRWEDLTDATFTRALAASVARHLKTDPAAVLSALPSQHPMPLVMSDGLGKAAADHKARSDQGIKPLAWAVAVLLLASAGMYFVPRVWPLVETFASNGVTTPSPPPHDVSPVDSSQSDKEAISPTDAAVVATDTVLASPSMPVVANAPSPEGAKEDVMTKAPEARSNASPLLTLDISRDTWVEVTDNAGRLRIQRVMKAGETLVLSDATSLAVVIGNAAGAQVVVRGQAMDLSTVVKNNIARFEVK